MYGLAGAAATGFVYDLCSDLVQESTPMNSYVPNNSKVVIPTATKRCSSALSVHYSTYRLKLHLHDVPSKNEA